MAISSLKYFIKEGTKNTLIITHGRLSGEQEYLTCFKKLYILSLDNHISDIESKGSYDTGEYYSISNIPVSTMVVDSVIIQVPLGLNNFRKLYPVIKTLKQNNEHLFILMMGTNFLGYNSFLKKNILKSTPLVSQLALRLLGFTPRYLYLSRYRIDFLSNGFVDILSSKSCGDTTDVSGSIFVRLKERILAHKYFMPFWPYYLLTASTYRDDDYLSSIIDNILTRSRPVGEPSNSYVIDRYIMGNANVDVVLFREFSSPDNQYVARIPNDNRGEKLCGVNYSFIEQYANSCIGKYIPAPLIKYSDRKKTIFVESKLTGYELISYENDNENIAKRAFDIIDEFQSKNKRYVDRNRFLKTIEIITDFTFVDCDDEIKSKIKFISDEISTILGDDGGWLVPCHGDYKIGNLLFDKNKSILGIIDWDHFDEQCVPLYDHMTFVVHLIGSRFENINSAECFSSYVLPWKVDGYIDQLLKNSMRIYNISENEFLAYRILYWLYNIKSRYLFKFSDERWLREYFEIPLDSIVVFLKNNSSSLSIN